jgi:hypothetical protein
MANIQIVCRHRYLCDVCVCVCVGREQFGAHDTMILCHLVVMIAIIDCHLSFCSFGNARSVIFGEHFLFVELNIS